MKENNQLQKNNSFLGFTKNKTALQSGRIEKCLSKAFRYNGVVMERRDAMLEDLRNGKVPAVIENNENGKNRKLYRLNFEIDGSKVYNSITKTEYDFCMYLIENNLVSEEQVNAYIENEKMEAEKIEEVEHQEKEKAAKMEEKTEEEAREFDAWLNTTARTYENTEKMNLMEKIFIDKCGNFNCSATALALLACIDNIDENPLCRNELKERLHTNNVASRKTFECITGLKLPKNNRDTKEFINNLKKSDYKEMKEYKVRKKPEKIKENKEINKNKSIFYVLQPNPTYENAEYVRIWGEGIRRKGFDCFIHETPDGQFGISSAECGMTIITGKTKSEAVKKLKKFINKIGDVKLRRKIKEAIDACGLSPLYKTA